MLYNTIDIDTMSNPQQYDQKNNARWVTFIFLMLNAVVYNAPSRLKYILIDCFKNLWPESNSPRKPARSSPPKNEFVGEHFCFHSIYILCNSTDEFLCRTLLVLGK